MKRARQAVAFTLGITALAVLLSLLVPVPKDEVSFDFHFNLAFSLATMILYIGGAVVTVMGFGAFTSQLRRAYTFIFAGSGLWAVGYLQLPLLVVFGLFDNDFVLTFTVIPYIVSAVLVFIGTRMLAGLFSVKSIATKWWFALIAVVAVTTVVVALPHTPLPSGDAEAEADVVNGLIMAVATLFTIGAYHILLVKRRASISFANALAWLCLSMGTVALLAAVGSTIAAMALPSNGQLTIVVAIVPSCLAGAMFLRSAYSFNKIVESKDVEGQSVARNFFGKPLKARPQQDTNSVDIVIYAAGLVSKPGDIDMLLDTVRFITAHSPDGKPEAKDDQTLMETYLKVEDYLLAKESLRVFTKEGLRQDIAQTLRLTADSTGTFWPKLSPRAGEPQKSGPDPQATQAIPSA